jgi:hypothetical protein
VTNALELVTNRKKSFKKRVFFVLRCVFVGIRVRRSASILKGCRRLAGGKLAQPPVKSPEFSFALAGAMERTILEEELALLGTMADQRLAPKLKRTRRAVQMMRLTRGIPAIRPGYKYWTPEDDDLLGRRPDREIALLLGHSAEAVKHRRCSKGIPPYQGQ